MTKFVCKVMEQKKVAIVAIGLNVFMPFYLCYRYVITSLKKVKYLVGAVKLVFYL
jgi:hypothetical protein